MLPPTPIPVLVIFTINFNNTSCARDPISCSLRDTSIVPIPRNCSESLPTSETSQTRSHDTPRFGKNDGG